MELFNLYKNIAIRAALVQVAEAPVGQIVILTPWVSQLIKCWRFGVSGQPPLERDSVWQFGSETQKSTVRVRVS